MEADKDENPVYRIYYASDGDKIDAGVNEITDESQYYATQLGQKKITEESNTGGC